MGSDRVGPHRGQANWPRRIAFGGLGLLLGILVAALVLAMLNNDHDDGKATPTPVVTAPGNENYVEVPKPEGGVIGWNCWTEGTAGCGGSSYTLAPGFETDRACVFENDNAEKVMCRDGKVYMLTMPTAMPTPGGINGGGLPITPTPTPTQGDIPRGGVAPSVKPTPTPTVCASTIPLTKFGSWVLIPKNPCSPPPWNCWTERNCKSSYKSAPEFPPTQFCVLSPTDANVAMCGDGRVWGKIAYAIPPYTPKPTPTPTKATPTPTKATPTVKASPTPTKK